MSSEDKVLFDVQGNVGVITLNRPKQRNAQDLELLQRLDELWMQAAADEQVKVIVLNAAGPHFSAGHDISEKAMDQVTNVDWDDPRVVETLYAYESSRALQRCRVPVLLPG
jgi:enoyl-CoA hydratase